MEGLINHFRRAVGSRRRIAISTLKLGRSVVCLVVLLALFAKFIEENDFLVVKILNLRYFIDKLHHLAHKVDSVTGRVASRALLPDQL